MIYSPRVLQLQTSEQLRAELERVGAESSFAAASEMAARAECRIVKLSGVSLSLARLLYQELTMEGGQVVTAAGIDHTGPGRTDLLLCGTRYQLEHLIIRLKWQPSEELELLAAELAQALAHFEGARPRPLVLGRAVFEWGTRTYLMGILNVTPDSFSGDGLMHPGDSPGNVVERAVERARQMAAAGVDLLDIGGESTHPRAAPLDAETELERVLPVLKAVAASVDVPLSVDTYKAAVARAALEAGAHLVNDVWGLRRDPALKSAVAAAGASVVVNHNWQDVEQSEKRRDFIGDIINDLHSQLEAAVQAGIPEEKIIVDPGLGFGKTLEQNLELLDRLGELRVFGRPILIGPSRKGFIGRALQIPPGQEEEGTAAAVTVGIMRGADMVRVHDVVAMARVARMTDRIVRETRKQV